MGAAVVLLFAAAGCGWIYPGYNAANTGYNPVESTLSASNVSGLQYHWSGSQLAGNEILAVKGRVYTGNDTAVTAYDEAGVQGCSGSPKLCQPLLTFSKKSTCTWCRPFAVADDTLFAFSGNLGLPPATFVDAFDATGSQGCDAAHACSPIRSYLIATSGVTYPPVVVDGTLYAASSGGLSAFDAHGVQGCAGPPQQIQCYPVWAAQTTMSVAGPALIGGPPVIADGMMYLGTSTGLEVFDAAGQTNCSGVFPNRGCKPLWTSTLTPQSLFAPAVANGRVYTSDNFGQLRVWDAQGQTGCSGSPRTCTPLWTSSPGLAGSGRGSPMVTSTYTLVPTSGDVLMYDAAGNNGCSGVPLTCTPIWSPGFGGTVNGANGLAVIANPNQEGLPPPVRVVDTRTQHPTVLFSVPATNASSTTNAIIADGSLVFTQGDFIHSYGLG